MAHRASLHETRSTRAWPNSNLLLRMRGSSSPTPGHNASIRPGVTRPGAPRPYASGPPCGPYCSHQVRQHQCAERNNDDLEDRHRGFGDGVDATGEQVPEPSSESYPDRHPGDDADERGNRCLPCDGDGELVTSEAKSLEQGEVASPPANRGGRGETEGNDGTHCQSRRQDARGCARRLVVHDLGRALDAEHLVDVALALLRA